MTELPRLSPILLAVGAITFAGCGGSSHGDLGNGAGGSSDSLTKAEQTIPLSASMAAGDWCEQLDPATGTYDANTRALVQSHVTVANIGLIALAQQKPNAVYDDTYGVGKVTLRELLKILGNQLRPCDAFGSKEGRKLIDAAP